MAASQFESEDSLSRHSFAKTPKQTSLAGFHGCLMKMEQAGCLAHICLIPLNTLNLTDEHINGSIPNETF